VIKFLPVGFTVWKATLGHLDAIEPAYDIFVLAPDLVAAHDAAMMYEQETGGDNLVLFIGLAADCILDGTTQVGKVVS